jgi:hypothetical protein
VGVKPTPLQKLVALGMGWVIDVICVLVILRGSLVVKDIFVVLVGAFATWFVLDYVKED